MPAALTHEEVRYRLAARNISLLSDFTGTQRPIRVRCEVHGVEYEVRAHSLVCEQKRMRCCQAAQARAQMTGRSVSVETRRKCSEVQQGGRAYWSGKRLSVEHRAAISASGRAHYSSSVDAFIAHAKYGSTAGKRGCFYIIRAGNGLLKFGSVSTMTLNARMRHIRAYTGSAELVLSAVVPDAGAYEAAMMDRYREHWARGEFFHDFLGSAP